MTAQYLANRPKGSVADPQQNPANGQKRDYIRLADFAMIRRPLGNDAFLLLPATFNFAIPCSGISPAKRHCIKDVHACILTFPPDRPARQQALASAPAPHAS